MYISCTSRNYTISVLYCELSALKIEYSLYETYPLDFFFSFFPLKQQCAETAGSMCAHVRVLGREKEVGRRRDEGKCLGGQARM